MSNYLQNLIAKSFNQAEVARPRLASMFEPLAKGAPTAFDEIRALETPDFEGAQRDGQSTNSMRENRQAAESKKALPLPTMNPSSEKIETSVWRGNQPSATLDQMFAETQTPHRQTMAQNRVDVQTSVPPQVSDTKPQEKASRKPAIANLQDSKLQPRREPTAETSSAKALPEARALMQQEMMNPLIPAVRPFTTEALAPQMQKAPAQIRRPINGQLAKREMEESTAADLPGAMETNKVTGQPRRALPVESQRASGRLNTPHQPPIAQQGETLVPPTINVTIGRIEVRATPTTQAQPRKASPVAQTMSLDEYLRKRNQGGER